MQIMTHCYAPAFLNSIIFFLLAIKAVVASPGNDVYSIETDSTVTLQNGYVSVSYDKNLNRIEKISADFNGGGLFATNVLSKPLQLVVLNPESESCKRLSRPAKFNWNNKSAEFHELKIYGITDCLENPLVKEDWTIQLKKNSRLIEIKFDGEVIRDDRIAAIFHGLYTKSPSIYGFFDRGIAQMMNKDNSCMGSDALLFRTYMMGNGCAVDFVPGETKSTVQSPEIVLLSQSTEYNSGLQDVLVGKYPVKSFNMSEAWISGGVTKDKSCALWPDSNLVAVRKGDSWSRSIAIVPNNYDFPAYPVAEVGRHSLTDSYADISSTTEDSKVPVSQMNFTDLRTFLTGVYGSPAGCMQTYYANQQGIIAPTVSHPDVGYSPDSNFFDPDNFIALSALMYSDDTYLLKQAQAVLERTAQTMCGIGSAQDVTYCTQSRSRLTHTPIAFAHSSNLHRIRESPMTTSRDGQLMHHFIDLVPTYESIAGSEQLGPNIFWTMSVLRYVSLTQDIDWGLKMYPYVDLSTRYLLAFFDESVDLIKAPGPLWIDVIVRENYTSDSSAMMVPFLEDIAAYYDLLEMEPDFSAQLRDVSNRISAAMNAKLWVSDSDTEENDHFITQLNMDGTSRDFVDFDSNLIAVAFGVASPDRATKILARVDAFAYSHVRATWCSEIPYSGNASDCYIVGGDYCGDSIVTLARIGWVDALARKRTRDLRTFEDLLLQPLQADLMKDVWLYERYDQNGVQIRTPFYFEYPSLVAIMLREVKYGINVGLSNVWIDPLMQAEEGAACPTFTYSVGNTYVFYSCEKVVLKLPVFKTTSNDIITPSGQERKMMLVKKHTSITGLPPNIAYAIQSSKNCANHEGVSKISTDDLGVLSFSAVFSGEGCVWTVLKV